MIMSVQSDLIKIYQEINKNAEFNEIDDSFPTYNNVIETVFITNSEVQHKINLDRGHGITNIRIYGDWKNATLCTSQYNIDTITKIFGEHSFHITNDGRFIPNGYQTLYLNIEKDNNEDKFMITYDLVLYDTYKYNRTQFLYKHHCNLSCNFKGTKDIILNFCHPTEKIMVRCANPIESVTLSFDYNPNKLEFVKLTDDYWILDFGGTVNFSRIDTITLHVTSNMENNIDICSVAHNIFRCYDGDVYPAFINV